MEVTYRVPRTPTTILAVLATLLVTLIVGATGGYLLRGQDDTSATTVRPASIDTSPIASSGLSPVYEQGGRPNVVYDDASDMQSK
jgi:hypothetical protein